MALPKGFRNDIKLVNPKVGLERRQEMVDFLSDKNTFLPKGVHYKDIDTTFIDFIKQDLKIEVDGEEVPVIFLTIQRYSEFTKTWKFTDEYKNIKLPFITIVRKPDVQVGTNYAGLYNIPGKPLYTYYKVPTNDGARTGVDLYKVPQPTSVDITYEVRLFTNKMSDLNLYNEKIQIAFNARQYYIWPNGHPMPVTLESVGDESNIDDFENRRFYVQPFEMLLAGYILDENDFEVIPTINRAMVMSEISSDPAKARTSEKNVNTRGPIVAVQGNVRVVNTIGNFISTVPCNEQYVVQNSTISNSGNTYSVSLPATVNLALPNVTHYDSDGQPVELPAMVGFTAQTCEDATYTLVNTATPPDTLDSGSIAAGGGETIIAPPSTWSLQNTDGDPLNSGTIPSNEAALITAPDGDVTVNSVAFASVPSDGTLNIPVVNGGSNPVGSEQGGEWVIGNSDVFINGVQVADIVAEDTANLAVELDGVPSGTWNAGTQTWEVTAPDGTVNITNTDNDPIATVTVASGGVNPYVIPNVAWTQSDGTPQSTPYGDAIVCTMAGPSGSVSVTVSNATPTTGQIITITATPTGFTANNYLFFNYDGSTIEEIVEQAGGVYNWFVDRAGTYDIYAVATDGTVRSWGKVGVVAASGFVLNQIVPQPVWAVSLRRLTSAYTGPAAIVRRSSDNTTQNIGYIGETLDTAALTAFVGVGNGFTATLYDQIGVNNAFQSTAGNQPSIVLSGAVNLLNGKAAINFSSVAQRLSLPSPVSMSHCFTVAKKNATNRNLHMLIGAGGGTGLAFGGVFAISANIFFNSAGGNLISTVNDTLPHQISLRLGVAGSGRLRIDGVTQATGTTSAALAVNAIGVDTAFPNDHLFNGNFSEAILYASVLSDADELVIENNQRAYYGL